MTSPWCWPPATWDTCDLSTFAFLTFSMRMLVVVPCLDGVITISEQCSISTASFIIITKYALISVTPVNNAAGALYTVSSVRWHRSLLRQWNVDWKRNVLSCWQNVSSDSEALIIGGRSFHALAAVTGKAWLQCRAPGWWNDQQHCVGWGEVTTTWH